MCTCECAYEVATVKSFNNFRLVNCMIWHRFNHCNVSYRLNLFCMECNSNYRAYTPMKKFNNSHIDTHFCFPCPKYKGRDLENCLGSSSWAKRLSMSCLGSLQHLWGELLLGAMAVQIVTRVRANATSGRESHQIWNTHTHTHMHAHAHAHTHMHAHTHTCMHTHTHTHTHTHKHTSYTIFSFQKVINMVMV